MNISRWFGRLKFQFSPISRTENVQAFPIFRYHEECGDRFPPPVKTGQYRIYKLMFYFVSVPVIIGMSLWNYREYQHEKKCYKRPPFVKRKYMYRRTKRFPWGEGNKSLFHNKLKNALPEGYED